MRWMRLRGWPLSSSGRRTNERCSCGARSRRKWGRNTAALLKKRQHKAFAGRHAEQGADHRAAGKLEEHEQPPPMGARLDAEPAGGRVCCWLHCGNSIMATHFGLNTRDLARYGSAEGKKNALGRTRTGNLSINSRTRSMVDLRKMLFQNQLRHESVRKRHECVREHIVLLTLYTPIGPNPFPPTPQTPLPHPPPPAKQWNRSKYSTA